MPGIFEWKGHLAQTTDAQVRRLMKEARNRGNVGQSALRSGIVPAFVGVSPTKQEESNPPCFVGVRNTGDRYMAIEAMY